MPTKLKTLIAHATAAGRRPFEPGRVRRQQQWLQYGSGVAITAFILVCTALVVRLELLDYVGHASGAFLRREALLSTELQSTNLVLGGYAKDATSLWQSGRQASPDMLKELAAGRGRFAWRRDGRAEFVGLTDIAPDRPASTMSRYLGAIEPQLKMATRTTAIAPGFNLYMISPDGAFLAVVGVEAARRALALPDGFQVKALARQLMPSDADVAGNDAIRVERRFDPLLGQSVMRFIRPLADADGRLFAWSVIVVRPQIDRILASQSSDEAHALIDPHAQVLAGAQSSKEMIAQALGHARDPHGEHMVVRRIGTRFVMSDHVPNTGLVLMTTFSWRSILAATATQASLTGGTALFAIALLWIAIVLFDRRALRPANRRAIRLIESEALNRTLIRTAPAGLMLLSLANGDTMVRNEAAQVYGGEGAEPSLGRRIWQAYRDSAAGGRAPRVVTHELSVELGAGTAYLAAHIVRTRYRGVDVLLCTLTDITARRQMEHKLREAREAADDANKAKSTFLATMSHEIRTPLNAIVGNLELMERAQLPADEQRRLQTVMSSSDALLHMINDVLDLSKVESNQMALEAIPFDLRAMLRDVAAVFRPLADAKQLALECRIAPGLANGYVGDPTRLRQIVSNLVSNAIKFTEHGGVTIDARPAAARGSPHGVEIAVRDTGIGIPSAALPTLFDVYVQTDPSIYRRFGGTGLGLPLCGRLARLMGGALTVDSRPGAGTTFVAALPLADAPSGWRATCDDVPATAPALPMHADDGAPLRVLVAEDHPASRALLRDQLDALHCDATLVSNGVEAMRAFFAQPFDVVLTDLGMPELDGFALANFLREQGATVPVIAMTAHATDEDRRRCAQAGAAEVVLKPLSIDALDAVLRRHAGRGAAMQPDRREPIAVTDEMRQKLRAATLRSLPAIDAALASGDRQAVRLELHSMRGGFAVVGDAEAAAACAQMERLEKEADMAELRIRWPAFQDEIRHALARLCDTAYPGAGRAS